MKNIYILLTLIIFSSSCFISAQTAQSAGEEKTTELVLVAYPVTLFSDTLFYIDKRQASLSPQERAVNISKRLSSLFEDDFMNVENIKTSHYGNYVDIVCDEMVVMSVSDADAESHHLSNLELANKYIKIIRDGIERAKKDRSFIVILVRTGLVLLVLAGIWLMIMLIRKGHLWVVAKITVHKDRLLKNLTYKDYTFLTAEQELNVIFWLLKIFKWLVIIILVYLLRFHQFLFFEL